jgi:hypothetical protein
MALDWGPESTVRTPGDNAREESREVANVRVVKGRSFSSSSSSPGLEVAGRRWGSRKSREEGGKVNVSGGSAVMAYKIIDYMVFIIRSFFLFFLSVGPGRKW